MTTCRPPRSRTCRTLATSQPERATRARPGFDRQARRSSIVGDRVEQTPAVRARTAPARERARRAAGPGNRHRDRACRRPAVRRAGARRRPGRGGPHPARHRPPGAGNRRAGGRHAAGSRRRRASRATRPGRSPRSRSSRTSTSRSPTARPGRVSGATSGLSRTSTSSAGRSPLPSPARRAIRVRTSASSADSRATHARGVRPAAVERTASRRSASVLPTPSSVIRSFGTPARRAIAHSPRETTLAPNPRAVDLGDDRRDVVGLDRVLADPRIGEGDADRGGGTVERREVGDVDRRAEAGRRGPQRVREAGRPIPVPRSRSESVRDDHPDDRADDAQDRPRRRWRRRCVSAVSRSGGKSPTVRSKAAAWRSRPSAAAGRR